MILWRLFALNILFVKANITIEGEDNEAVHVMQALNAVLEAEPQHRDFVLLLKSEGSLIEDVTAVRAPWGIGVFEVKVDDQNRNLTWAYLSSVGKHARQLRVLSWSVTVVVVSDDPDFLTTFSEWSLKGRLLVWSTRLLVLTRIPLHRLQHLRNTLAMTNSMLLHVSQTSPLRAKVYIDLPYTRPGSKMLSIASWSPETSLRKELQMPYYPAKFSKFSTGARLVVAREIQGLDKTQIIDDPDEPGEKKIQVFNAHNALIESIGYNMNFTIKYLSPPDGHWGMLLPDGTWSGMIGMVHRQEADIGMGLFTITSARYEAVDFSYPVDVAFHNIFWGRRTPGVDPWSFLLPLTPLVWVVLLTSLLGVVIVATLLLSCSPFQTNPWHMAQNTSATYIRVLLQQDLFVSSDIWWWERVVVGVWMLMTLVLTRSYSGNLISQLAVQYVPEPLHTLEDFVPTAGTLIIHPGTSTEEAFKTATSGIYKNVWDVKQVGRIMLIPLADDDKVIEAIRKDNSITSITLGSDSMKVLSLEFSLTGRCDFYIGRGMYLPSLESLAIAKGSSLQAPLSRKVMQLLEGGLHWYWSKLYYRNLTSCLNPPRKFAVKAPLAITNIWGMFVVLLGGVVASLLIFIKELLYPRLQALL